MVIVLPTRTDVPHYDFEIDLDGATYPLELRWNDRAGAWLLDVRDVLGEILLSGRRVSVDLPLLGRIRDPRLPAGELVAVDTSGRATGPAVNELGGRVRLLYYGADDNPLGRA